MNPNINKIGPFSAAIRTDHYLFISGQLGINPETATISCINIEGQTTQALNNLEDVLKKNGCTTTDICKINIYVTDLSDYHKVNEVYKEFFQFPFPARTCVQVAALPLGSKIEIEAIAIVHKNG